MLDTHHAPAATMQPVGVASEHASQQARAGDWLMKRNCSLTPRQVGTFYLSMVLVSSAIATFFLLRGAWLVLPFTGLEMTVLGAALLVYARHATDYERVCLTEHGVVVERMDAGRFERLEFNRQWVRVGQQESPIGLVSLQCGRQTLELGRFLPPHRRAGFARELKGLLLSGWWRAE